MKAFSFKGIWNLLKDSIKGFSADKVTKLGGSLAYFAVFSIGPLLLVVIFLVGLLLGKQAIEGSLQGQLQQSVGEEGARQLQQIIKSAATSKQGALAGFIGMLTLVLGATTMFGEIRDSINGIWQLKIKPKHGWRRMLQNKLLAFVIVACMGFLLLASLAATWIIEVLGNKLEEIIPRISVVIFYVIGHAFTLLIATTFFGLVFKILPAALIRWRDIWPGAFVSALLFMAGRFALSLYISRSDFGSAYGAAGSLVVLMVWVYYSSLILYFGAEFTRAYAKRFGSGIHPREYAFSTV